MLQLVISKYDLEQALAHIKAAEDRGFNNTVVIFNIAEVGRRLQDCIAEYSGQALYGSVGKHGQEVSHGNFRDLHEFACIVDNVFLQEGDPGYVPL